MSEESRPQSPNNPDPQVQVHDRRRFTAEGEPVPGAPDIPETANQPDVAAAPEVAPTGASPDPRDLVLAQQAARIDELTRAYAALVEEGKAARARLEREKTRVLEAERANIAQALLEAVDELERALAAAQGAATALSEGVAVTLAALRKRVSELGAERFVTQGQRFDPRLHEAIDLVPVTDPALDEQVVEEVRAGYRIGDRVLRPARVRVGRLTRT